MFGQINHKHEQSCNHCWKKEIDSYQPGLRFQNEKSIV